MSKVERNLRNQNRFYVAGWFDAKRGERPQHNTRAEDTNYFVDYMHGYSDCLYNEGQKEKIEMQESGWIDNKADKTTNGIAELDLNVTFE